MQVIRRADAHDVHALGRRTAAELLEMPIEAFELCEKAHIERVAIEHSDRIVRIDGGDKTVAGVCDCLQMPRRHEAGDAGDGEVHNILSEGVEGNDLSAVAPPGAEAEGVEGARDGTEGSRPA